MIVLEGPDGAGKTTLAWALAKEMNNCPVYHPGGPAVSADEFRVRVTAQERQEGVIHDRAMVISEPIYATILGRPIAYTVSAAADYYLRHLDFPMYVIYCRLGSINEMFDNISRERKEHKSEEHIQKMRRNYLSIVNAYDERMEALHSFDYPKVIPIHYNWYIDGIENLMEKLKEKRV